MYSVQTAAITPNEKRWKKYAKPQSKVGLVRPNSTAASKRSQHMKRVRALMLLGGKCESCDNNDMRVLHIDHRDNDGAAHRLEVGRHGGIIKAVFQEPLRFQLLCANCHEIKHTSELT